MGSADKVQWKKAMDETFNSLIISNTWKLVKRPEEKRDVVKDC